MIINLKIIYNMVYDVTYNDEVVARYDQLNINAMDPKKKDGMIK